MAVTSVRKFSVNYEGQLYKVLFIVQDDKAGVKYCVASSANEKLWVDDEKVSMVIPDLE